MASHQFSTKVANLQILLQTVGFVFVTSILKMENFSISSILAIFMYFTKTVCLEDQMTFLDFKWRSP